MRKVNEVKIYVVTYEQEGGYLPSTVEFFESFEDAEEYLRDAVENYVNDGLGSIVEMVIDDKEEWGIGVVCPSHRDTDTLNFYWELTSHWVSNPEYQSTWS